MGKHSSGADMDEHVPLRWRVRRAFRDFDRRPKRPGSPAPRALLWGLALAFAISLLARLVVTGGTPHPLAPFAAASEVAVIVLGLFIAPGIWFYELALEAVDRLQDRRGVVLTVIGPSPLAGVGPGLAFLLGLPETAEGAGSAVAGLLLLMTLTSATVGPLAVRRMRRSERRRAEGAPE